jgi:hypothetical protein
MPGSAFDCREPAMLTVTAQAQTSRWAVIDRCPKLPRLCDLSWHPQVPHTLLPCVLAPKVQLVWDIACRLPHACAIVKLKTRIMRYDPVGLLVGCTMLQSIAPLPTAKG